MQEMMPWSDKYRQYETRERLNAPWAKRRQVMSSQRRQHNENAIHNLPKAS